MDGEVVQRGFVEFLATQFQRLLQCGAYKLRRLAQQVGAVGLVAEHEAFVFSAAACQRLGKQLAGL
ncbi:hypothetical protein D3C84_1307940 [compost metagenome]